MTRACHLKLVAVLVAESALHLLKGWVYQEICMRHVNTSSRVSYDMLHCCAASDAGLQAAHCTGECFHCAIELLCGSVTLAIVLHVNILLRMAGSEVWWQGVFVHLLDMRA